MSAIESIKKEKQILESVFVFKISLLEKISFITILGACSYTGLWLFGKQARGNYMIIIRQYNKKIYKL